MKKKMSIDFSLFCKKKKVKNLNFNIPSLMQLITIAAHFPNFVFIQVTELSSFEGMDKSYFLHLAKRSDYTRKASNLLN